MKELLERMGVVIGGEVAVRIKDLMTMTAKYITGGNGEGHYEDNEEENTEYAGSRGAIQRAYYKWPGWPYIKR
jgi:hypothetical protein